MAIGYPPLTDDRMAKEFVARFTEHVAAGIRERIMEHIQPDIDAAVNAGLASLKTEIQAYADLLRQRVVIQAVVNKEPVELG